MILRPNPKEIARAWGLFSRPGQVRELRIPKAPRRGTISGYFNNVDALIKSVTSLGSAGPGIYISLNPVRPDLFARAANHVQTHAQVTTADRDALCRQWILLDFDAIRPAGISATEPEHQAALERARDVRMVLSEEGWPPPILIDSGNGGHLTYAVDLPNDDDAAKLVERLLKALAGRFDDARVKVDQSVYNASRIFKLPGTAACKGDDLFDRPHRLAKILEAPSTIDPVSHELLQEFVASQAPPPPRDPPRQSRGTFSVEEWIRRHQLDVCEPVSYNGGRKWAVKKCPFNPAHQAPDAAIFETADQRPGFRCLHDSCRGKGWHELREHIEGPATARAEAASEWPTPLPLHSELPPVEPFSAELLPDAFRPLATDVSERMRVCLDLPAIVIVLCLAGVVNRRARIRPKVFDISWLVVPNLWGGLIALPGFLKSPVMQTITSLLFRIQSNWRHEYEKALEYYTQEKEAHEIRLAVWKAKLKEAAKEGRPEPVRPPEPAAPVLRRLIVNDATFEALHQTMAENPEGLLVVRDELTGWWSMLDRPGREGERAFCLQAWNGDTGHIIDRIGRGSVHVEACCMSMLGGIQPGRLRSYLTDALRDGPSNDGLIQRFQLLTWPDMASAWEYIDRPPDVAAEDRVRRIFEALAKLDAASPLEYHFAPDAQELFMEWLTELEAKLRSGELHPALVSHLSKYRSLMPSLALLFEMAAAVVRGEWGDTVSLDTTRQAAAWCSYLESHARRVYSCIVTPQIRAALELADKIKSKKVGADGFFSCRDVYLKRWTSLDSPEAVKQAADVLEDAGWIRDVSGKSGPAGGRPSNRYQINPGVWA